MVAALVVAAALLGLYPEASCGAGSKPARAKDEKAVKAVKYVEVKTANYTFEVPQGWKVGEETPFGQREMHPSAGGKQDETQGMSSMTGPGLGKRSWQDLYDTSLYFITRYAPKGGEMKATKYVLGKSKQGFETCSWSMLDAAGRTIQRHVILKHADGNILALSVKLPPSAATEDAAQLEAHFRHMVNTAIVR